MLESFLVVGESVGVIVEEFNGDGEEVIEIHSACCAEASLVFVVDLCDFPIENAVGSVKCCVGGYEFIFENITLIRLLPSSVYLNLNISMSIRGF